MTFSENTQTNIRLVPAIVDQKPIIANLLELYSHDFCDFLDREIGPDGRFGYPNLDLYWREQDRRPFLLTSDDKLAGFVLVHRLAVAADHVMVWDMAEFFILRGQRRRGIGTEASHLVFREFPGPWQVRVMSANEQALRFWEHAVASFAGRPVRPSRTRARGMTWNVFSFAS